MEWENEFNTNIKERTSFKVQQPHQYAVIMLNDDFTPMEFVVEVLMLVFRKEQQAAIELMLAVHQTGQAVVGVYTYDIAASKRARVMAMAREAGYPFRVEIKEEK